MRGRSLIETCVLGAAALFFMSGCGDKTTPAPDKAKAEDTKPTEAKPDEKKAEEPKPEAKADEGADEKKDDEGAEEKKDEGADEKKDEGADDKQAGTTPKTNDTKTAAEPKKEEPKKPTGPVVGEQATVVASVKADPGYKCNDAYPHKFVTSGGSNVKYPNPKPKGGCAGKHAISVPVPYIPTAAGSGSVSGTLKYGICDEAKTNCRVVKKQMTLPFTASES
jgi:hypothetical protein